MGNLFEFSAISRANSRQLHCGALGRTMFLDPASSVPSLRGDSAFPDRAASCLVADDGGPSILTTKNLDICFLLGSKLLQNPYPCAPVSSDLSVFEIGWGSCATLCKGLAKSFRASASDLSVAGTESVMRIPMSLHAGFVFIRVCKGGESCNSHEPKFWSLIGFIVVYVVVEVGSWCSVTREITSAKMLMPSTSNELRGRAADMKRAAAIVPSLALPMLRNDVRLGFIVEITEVAASFEVLLPLGATTSLLGVVAWVSAAGVLDFSILMYESMSAWRESTSAAPLSADRFTLRFSAFMLSV